MRQTASVLQRSCHQIRSFSDKPFSFKLYESNIDPFIRFLHENDIDPCGWVQIPANKYRYNTDILKTNCNIDISTSWSSVKKVESGLTALFKILSFDIECSSYHGDFPMAKKDYRKLAYQMYDLYHGELKHELEYEKQKFALFSCICYAIGEDNGFGKVDRLSVEKKDVDFEKIKRILLEWDDELCCILESKAFKAKETKAHIRDNAINNLNKKLSCCNALPKVHKDSIIQIGTTVHIYGEKKVNYKNIITFGECSFIDGVDVISCNSETEVLLQWTNLIKNIDPDIDPDVVTGYNIFGFDFNFLYERAQELNIQSQFMCLGRFEDRPSEFREIRLSSSALGDNFMKYINMEKRVLIDLHKVIQREYKLEEYKLDVVAQHFIGQQKNDILPKDIF